ncbi:uncharacterized protein LOC121874538 [Homarus americanus]|uniref:uncharacterized protein LOC121874538 n=1 Tax=Homarus americanus TaxID=6706 RepID=UPI001C47B1C8|nr:uncharacterized protein LOC121874538 [Homarus americanus]
MHLSIKMKLLLAGMVVVVALTTVTILFYTLLLDSVEPITPRPVTYKEARLKQSEQYQVVVGTAIGSQFYTLKVYNCSSSNASSIMVQWNNIHWQKVEDRQIYLYHSFYDARYIDFQARYHYVRIIGMTQGKIQKEESYFCSMWYMEFQDPVVVKADTSEVWMQHWNRNPDPDTYHTYLFTCPVPLSMRDSHLYPDFVSVSSQPCGDITTKLPIQKKGFAEWQNGGGKKFAVCVKGMDFDEDISIKLIEWLELLFILGADQVFIYKYTIHKNVGKVFDYYEKKGKVKVISLTLPGDQPNEPKLRTTYLKRALWQKRRNELVPYNDCLYRNIYLFKYVIPLDIDEVIIPVKSYTWPEMFLEFQKKNSKVMKKFASFSAPNAYFFEAFNSTHNPSVPKYFHMPHHTIRSANFSIFGHSVKSFVSTRNSRTVFNHYTLETLYSNMKTYKVMNTSIVQMNHYKKRCPREIYSQCKSNFLVFSKNDNIIDKYIKELVYRVESVLEEIQLSV